MSAYEFESTGEDWPDYTRRPRANIAPLLVGGFFAAVALVMQSPMAAWVRGFLSARPPRGQGVRPIDSTRPLWLVRESIIGRPKAAVAAAYGHPRTALIDGSLVQGGNAFWRSDAWYYALDSHTRT